MPPEKFIDLEIIFILYEMLCGPWRIHHYMAFFLVSREIIEFTAH